MNATNNPPEEKEQLVNFISKTNFNVVSVRLLCGDPLPSCSVQHPFNVLLIKLTENTVLLEQQEQEKKGGFLFL